MKALSKLILVCAGTMAIGPVHAQGDAMQRSQNRAMEQMREMSGNAPAPKAPPAKGLEMVCQGGTPQSTRKIVYVNCTDRVAFINALGTAWNTLRKNQIGGSLEDTCFQAYDQAKNLHPSISLNGITGGFLLRCNQGLEYVK